MVISHRLERSVVSLRLLAFLCCIVFSNATMIATFSSSALNTTFTDEFEVPRMTQYGGGTLSARFGVHFYRPATIAPANEREKRNRNRLCSEALLTCRVSQHVEKWTFAPFIGRLVLPSAPAEDKVNAAVLLLPQNGFRRVL
jgi:hypothetical protein